VAAHELWHVSSSVHGVIAALQVILFLWPSTLCIGTDGLTLSRFGIIRFVEFSRVTNVVRRWNDIEIAIGSRTSFIRTYGTPEGYVDDILRSILELWQLASSFDEPIVRAESLEAGGRLLPSAYRDPHMGDVDPRSVLMNSRYSASLRIAAARRVMSERDDKTSLCDALLDTANPDVRSALVALIKKGERSGEP
jgi:hypothetical protein